MAQKPIRLEQLGITLDDIVVHLQDKAIIKREVIETQIVKEIDEGAVERLVAEHIANISIPTVNDITQIINEEIASQELTKPEVTNQSVNDMIVAHLATIPPITPINQIVEKIDLNALKFYVAEELKKHQRPTPPPVDTNSLQEMIASEVQKYIPEEPSPIEDVAPTNVDEHRVWANHKIDDAAASVRAKFVTVAHGQEALYAEKVDEATDYIADGATTADDFPLLLAEVNGTGKTPEQVVDDILTKRSQWISINAKIEEIRLRGKTVINSGDITTNEEIENTKNQAITQLMKL